MTNSFVRVIQSIRIVLMELVVGTMRVECSIGNKVTTKDYRAKNGVNYLITCTTNIYTVRYSRWYMPVRQFKLFKVDLFPPDREVISGYYPDIIGSFLPDEEYSHHLAIRSHIQTKIELII